ncbi:hypothetical protein BJY59DRAFT_695438, partial [Rhodotorula toruloides]
MSVQRRGVCVCSAPLRSRGGVLTTSSKSFLSAFSQQLLPTPLHSTMANRCYHIGHTAFERLDADLTILDLLKARIVRPLPFLVPLFRLRLSTPLLQHHIPPRPCSRVVRARRAVVAVVVVLSLVDAGFAGGFWRCERTFRLSSDACACDYPARTAV